MVFCYLLYIRILQVPTLWQDRSGAFNALVGRLACSHRAFPDGFSWDRDQGILQGRWCLNCKYAVVFQLQGVNLKEYNNFSFFWLTDLGEPGYWMLWLQFMINPLLQSSSLSVDWQHSVYTDTVNRASSLHNALTFFVCKATLCFAGSLVFGYLVRIVYQVVV